jgi:hypothetical protein
VSAAAERSTAHSNETYQNEMEPYQNQTKRYRTALSAVFVQFFWLNMTKRNGIILNDIENAFLTHTVYHNGGIEDRFV